MKKILKFIGIILILASAYFIYSNYSRLNIITGFSAKNVASGMFYAHRTQVSIEQSDNDFSPVILAANKADIENRTVSSTVFGLMKRKAVYIDGLGAILVNRKFDNDSKFDIPKRNKITNNLVFPYGELEQNDTVFSNVDYTKLNQVVKSVMNEGDENKKNTRSVLVIYKDHILIEEYAEGFDQSTPLLGWSMTKSITGTIYGILQKQGKIDIQAKTNIPEWQNDDRKDITYNDLLHMNSGLEWDEDYFIISDVTKMLFLESDMGRTQINKQLTGKPNESWNYSSGTANLLAGYLLRQQFKTHQEYLDFWYNELLDKIGMHSSLIETDMEGNYVGSSYGWANTRDWSKMGLLYLHRGNWNGEQIIDSTWVDYVSTPTNKSNGRYGAHFWLNAGAYYPDVSKDVFSMNGFQGQRIFIIPSKEMVVVRMGLTGGSKFDFNKFLSEIIKSID